MIRLLKCILLYALLTLSTSPAFAETANVIQNQVPIFVQTASVTVVNTTTETTLISSGIGTLTLVPNALTPGRVIKFWLMGIRSATGNPTERVQVKLNGTTIMDTGAVTSAAGTNEIWEIRGLISIRTAGVSGTAAVGGFYMEESGAGTNNIFGMTNTSPITINTTIAQTINVTWTWGTASTGNSLTNQNTLIEYGQ